MLPDVLISSSHLLIGCGSSIYRLINHSSDHYFDVLPEFIFASTGIAAIAGKCLFSLGYHLFWRKYPIDPLLIEEDINSRRNERNVIDSSLSIFGLASLIYALYHHHDYQATGVIIISSLALAEFFFMSEDLLKSQSHTPPEDKKSTDNHLKWLWILSFGTFGCAMNNNYARLATVPCVISNLIYPPDAFSHGWSLRNCLMDYMTLLYIILMTEAICQ
ncbi:uncharacterized protein [Fopius arisanus]|uniref:Uncharacterized protein n=1 Tax=Fopius arisanus TaxID=64838 RepID=A0A9R1TYY7_9HYME|nr:PREDICTED: uncharacterized protein LOC105265312 [Fopius arisanus]